VMAPTGSEVYINDERRGSVGSSGRVVLSDVPPGRHILRVSKAGERDDERLIEIREDADEQVIQAQFRSFHSHPSQGSSGASPSSAIPGIVACNACTTRFAEGVRFCGRCGGATFSFISEGTGVSFGSECPRCSAQQPDNSQFCGRCGLAMAGPARQSADFSQPIHAGSPPQVSRVCIRCGTDYPANIKFCGRCGLTLS